MVKIRNNWRSINVYGLLKDEKLNQAIVEGHSTLGWIGWHIDQANLPVPGVMGPTKEEHIIK